MANFSDFHDQRWIDKSAEIFRRADYQCEDCDARATLVHICYYPKDRKIWELPEDAYKCYCGLHFEDRKNTEGALKKILAGFSTNELDSLLRMLQELARMPLGKRATIMEQLYADSKKKHSRHDNFFEDEEDEE